MKKTIIILVLLGGVIAGAIVYVNKPKSAPPALVVADQAALTTSDATAAATKPAAPKTDLTPAIIPAKIETAPAATPEIKAANFPNPISKAVDELLAAKEGKHELLQQLVKSGQIDQVITELKQRMADNPDNAAIPTTLGEAQLNKVRALHEAGGDMNEIGILAMQADQSFNAALKIDPQNWEAQFVKASSMYYWPADPVRDNDTAQRLANLIDQQDSMTPMPVFAKPYAVLGDQYLKMGQPEKARATWQLGLSKFPNDPVLQKKISGQ